MGTYAPAPVMTDILRLKAVEKVLKPTIAAMKAEGRPYQGCLYAGLMINGDDIKVVEFNCRLEILKHRLLCRFLMVIWQR